MQYILWRHVGRKHAVRYDGAIQMEIVCKKIWLKRLQ